ncbi:MAG: phosphoglucomutase/phosphomannomutase family protein [Chloroflexi bacterium]|nr:phosphoglucomutase/phosphomannomutase family protein [Chloroflexota bacterium]
MSRAIKFGTDGWRAVIAEDFTFDNVRACAQGTADYLDEAGFAGLGVVIGYDTRFASEDFAAAVAEVLAANNIKVHLCSQAAPTPVISYLVTATKSAGAVIITASHNPGRWNGFKYKDSTGASAPTEIVATIEENANQALASCSVKRMALADGLKSGIIAYIDPVEAYFQQIECLVDLEAIRQSSLKVIVDSMYGAGMGYFKKLLQGGKIQIMEINGERNPCFPGVQPEPIAKNLAKLSGMVREQKASVGIANDGDADRIGIMDENGEFLNQLQVFALLTLYFLEVRKERGAIVKTLTDTNMLDMLGEEYGVPVYETPVGFKYVAPVMKEKDAMIGGEESGGYGFRGHVPERDGILAGLYFLDLMIKTGKTPSQLLDYLFSKVGPHFYDRIDVHITPEQKQPFADKLAKGKVESVAGIKVKKLDTRDGYKYCLADNSWLLIRFSGTEPLIRIYAEAQSQKQIQKLLDGGQKILGI